MPKVVRPALQELFIGVDPGAKGGFAALDISGKVYIAMPFIDMTHADIWDLVSNYGPNRQAYKSIDKGFAFAVLEEVRSMPGQGVSSMFSFGQIYGALRMSLTAAQIPFEEVRPQVWQKFLGVPKKAKEETPTAFKDRLRDIAQKLFPTLPLWRVPKTKGQQLAIADALLIAEYNRRKRTGQL